LQIPLTDRDNSGNVSTSDSLVPVVGDSILDHDMTAASND
jgi:hypothetical protein